MSDIDGFKKIPWPELKKKLLDLPVISSDNNFMRYNTAEKITDHTKMINYYIQIIDNSPPNKNNLSPAQSRRRRYCGGCYEKILKYYYLRIKLIEA